MPSEPASPEPSISVPHYWCAFTDETETKIRELRAHTIYLESGDVKLNPPEGAVLLSIFDERVQEALHPSEGRAVQRLALKDLDDLHWLAYRFDTATPKPVYRGQADYSWRLQTRIERGAPSGLALEEFEYRVISEAQRRLHHHVATLPDENDWFSWLALLRHHGVPTRLLDVTNSLFVACYFAVRDAVPGKDSAIWIVSRHHVNTSFSEWARRPDDTWLRSSPFGPFTHGKYYWPMPKNLATRVEAPTLTSLKDELNGLKFWPAVDAAIRGYVEKPGVAAVEPTWMSRRHEAQQGVFLVPFNVRDSFERNLFSFLAMSEDLIDERPVPADEDGMLRLWAYSKVIKLRVPASLHGILRVRLESMNIRELTLFPDAEGVFSHLTSLIPMEGR